MVSVIADYVTDAVLRQYRGKLLRMEMGLLGYDDLLRCKLHPDGLYASRNVCPSSLAKKGGYLFRPYPSFSPMT